LRKAVSQLQQKLLADVPGKIPATTTVIIDELDTDNWGLGGETVTARRKR